MLLFALIVGCGRNAQPETIEPIEARLARTKAEAVSGGLTMGRPVGERLFVDGVTRAVYEDDDGRQFVLDGALPVYGVWLPEVDECVVVGPNA
jgi:hypothetical protein